MRNLETTAILSKNPYFIKEWQDDIEDMSNIPQEAVKMGATVQSNKVTEPEPAVESSASDIQIRLEILKILFSSPHFGPDRGFTTKQVENWVKTGKNDGMAFVGWNV